MKATLLLAVLLLPAIAYAKPTPQPVPTVTPQPIPIEGAELTAIVDRVLFAIEKEHSAGIEHEAWERYLRDARAILDQKAGLKEGDIWQYDRNDGRLHFKGTAPKAAPSNASGTAR